MTTLQDLNAAYRNSLTDHAMIAHKDNFQKSKSASNQIGKLAHWTSLNEIFVLGTYALY